MNNKVLNYFEKRISFKKSKEKFFTPKRIIFITVFLAIFIVALFLTFWGLKINLGDIWHYFITAFNKNHLTLFFAFLILLFPITRFIYIFSYIRPILIANNIHLSWIEYTSLFFKILVINSITPFASGSEPYMVYWLKTRGLSLNQASIISICNGICSGICEILITIPSFALVSSKYNQIINTEMGLIIYWFIFAGLMVNFFVLSVFLISAFSAKTQYYVSVFFNFILKKLHLKYLEKQEIREKYLLNSQFKKDVIKMFKNIKYIAIIFLTYAIFSLYYYFTFYFSMEAMNLEQINYSHSFGTLFNIVNVAVTANNFIPIPSAEGTMQITLSTLTSIFDNSIFIDKAYINNVVGFWRIMTSYIPLIVALLAIIIYYLLKLYLIKKTNITLDEQETKIIKTNTTKNNRLKTTNTKKNKNKQTNNHKIKKKVDNE